MSEHLSERSVQFDNLSLFLYYQFSNVNNKISVPYDVDFMPAMLFDLQADSQLS